MSTSRVEKLTGIAAASRPRTRGAVASGAAAGLVGGGAMAAALVLAALAVDAPVLVAFRAIGAVVPGVEADGAAAVPAGILAHAAVSAALGVVFAALVPRDFPPACAAGVGVAFAALAMGVAVSLLLPVSFVRDLHDVGGGWVIAHGVYGVVLGLALQPPARARGAAPAPGAAPR